MVTAINFRFFPLARRVVVVGFAGALWNVYLCNKANKEPPSAHEVAEELPNQIVQASESIRHGDFQKEMRVS
jgi:hypothetical protein